MPGGYQSSRNTLTPTSCFSPRQDRTEARTSLFFSSVRDDAGKVASGHPGRVHFLNPLTGFVLGIAVRAGAGALSGSLVDYGINDDFVKSQAETIPPNSSALFILVRKVQPEKVLAELSGVKGKVLRTPCYRNKRKSFRKPLKGQPYPPQVDRHYAKSASRTMR